MTDPDSPRQLSPRDAQRSRGYTNMFQLNSHFPWGLQVLNPFTHPRGWKWREEGLTPRTMGARKFAERESWATWVFVCLTSWEVFVPEKWTLRPGPKGGNTGGNCPNEFQTLVSLRSECSLTRHCICCYICFQVNFAVQVFPCSSETRQRPLSSVRCLLYLCEIWHAKKKLQIFLDVVTSAGEGVSECHRLSHLQLIDPQPAITV